MVRDNSQYKKKPKELTGRQKAGVMALAKNPTVKDAALDAGVSSRTLFKWLNIPEFREAYDMIVQASHRKTLDFLKAASTEAAACLLAIVHDKTAPPYVKVQAATNLLTANLRYIETDEICRRLEAIENRLADYDGK